MVNGPVALIRNVLATYQSPEKEPAGVCREMVWVVLGKEMAVPGVDQPEQLGWLYIARTGVAANSPTPTNTQATSQLN